jgi:hypothetical protein
MQERGGEAFFAFDVRARSVNEDRFGSREDNSKY